MERVSTRVGVLVVAVGLSGCGNLGKSNEERINDAIPPGSAVLASKQRLETLLKSTADNLAEFEREYQSRLSERARECADGYQVSLFASNEKLREDLAGNPCFASADQALGEWVGSQRMAALLRAPPLRPASESPAPFISGAGGIQQPTFAASAGVVMLEMRDKHQLVDMQTSNVLFEGEGRWAMGSLSPNGRLMAAAGDDNRTEISEAETGEVLASVKVPSSSQFHWLDEVGAIFSERPKPDEDRLGAVVLFDFASGKRVPLPVEAVRIDKVLAIPGKPRHYLLLGHRRISEIALKSGAEGWTVQLLSEQPTELSAVDRNAVTAADGSYLVLARGEMKQLLVPGQQVRTLPLQPLTVDQAWATSDRDQLLIRTRLKGGRIAYHDFVYSLKEQTLAEVDASKLVSRRFIYIPSLKRNGIIDDSKIHVLDRIPTLPAQSVTSVVAQLEEENRTAIAEQNERRMEMDRMFADVASAAAGSPSHAANVQRLRAAMAARSGTGQTPIVQTPANAPLAEQARNARIEAVGVYEATNGVHGVGVQRTAGSVQVRVRRSSKPVILVLSAYEPVNWILTVEPEAKLHAVLVGGYHQGQVFGAGNARVVQLERGYAYKRGSSEYGALDAEVARWTGKPIESFQGRYDGSTFVTGL